MKWNWTYKDNSFPHARRDIHSCDLLLDQRKYEEVQYRAGETLEAARERGPVHAAMNLISLGRAHLLQEQEEGTRDYSQAAKHFDCAVENLRLGGAQDEIPRGLLARAALHRFTGDYVHDERDLAEALRIASRGGMGLHLADCHLESARLQLAQGNKDKAREYWKTAKEMIEHMGYHRRDNEVTELAEQLL